MRRRTGRQSPRENAGSRSEKFHGRPATSKPESPSEPSAPDQWSKRSCRPAPRLRRSENIFASQVRVTEWLGRGQCQPLCRELICERRGECPTEGVTLSRK